MCQGESEHDEDRIDTQLYIPQIVMKLSLGEQAALECIGNSLAAAPIITRMFVYSHSLPSYPLAVVIPDPVNWDNYTNVPSGFPPRTSEGVDREGLACSIFSPLAPSPSRRGPLPTGCLLQLSPLPSSPSSSLFWLRLFSSPRTDSGLSGCGGRFVEETCPSTALALLPS